jgi:hypothetical protein
MPNVNPLSGGGTGQAGLTNPNQYPQWAYNQQGQVIEADNAEQKTQDIQNGYLVWYNSAQGAASGAASQTGLGSGNISNPLEPLQDIGNFFHSLTESSTWVRVGEVAFGAILLWVGFKALTSQTPVGNAAQGAKRVAQKPVKAAVKVAAPETRYVSRIAAKRVAPKTTQKIAGHRRAVREYGKKRANP